MATKKNTDKSTRRAATATSNDPLGGDKVLRKRISGLFGLEAETWAECDKFIADQNPALLKEYGLEEGDLDGGLGIMAWIASLTKDAEREQQPRVDSAIQYLDPSISV